jgi:acyl carrier protein
MMQLRQQLKEALIRDLNLQSVTPADIGDDDPLFGEGLGLDSLDAVELVVLVQKRFGVEIMNMEEGREAFRSVAALSAFIEERRAK